MSLTELNNGEIVASFTLSSPAISTSIYFDFLLNCNKNGRYQDLSLLNESCEICDSDKLCDNHPNCSPGDIERYPLSDNISCFMIKNPGGYSSTLSSGIWEKCKSPCKLCSSNIDTCETCVFGYYLTSVGCINDITSYYKQSKSNNYDPDYYEKCDVACHICSNSTHENCTECSSNYYPLIDNSNACYIIEKAPIRYYFKQETNKFEKCDVSCFTCENTPKHCMKCDNASGYYNKETSLNTCTNSEPGYFIFNSVNNYYWKICDESCLTCENDAKQCTKCNSEKFLYFPKTDVAHECYLYSSPPNDYFYDKASETHKKCDISCSSCKTEAKHCLACNNNNNYKISLNYYNTDKYPNTCTAVVPNDYFLDTSIKIYSPCDISCNGCKTSSKNCDSCNQAAQEESKNYYPLVDNPNNCNLISSDYYYFNKTTKILDKCDISCKNCQNEATSCLKCNKNYFQIYNDSYKCVNVCPENLWTNFLTRMCSPCNRSCKTCLDESKECTKCEDRYFPLEDNKKHCFDVCPVGYIRDENREICKKCPPNCDKCTLDNKCTLCSKDNFLNKSDKLCNKTCERTYWPNSLNRQCDDCIPPCKECSDIKRCISCVNSLFLSPDLTMEDNCLTVCPNGHYANSDNNKCDSCKKGCKLCSSINICKSCDETFNYLEQKHECLAICPDRYYSLKKLISASNLEITESMRTCEKCQTGCLTCKDTSDFCTSCEIGLFRLEKENKCFNNCPVGYYNNFNINICSKCHPTCKTCIEDDESSCLTCDLLQDLVLNKGYCISKGCPPEHIFMEDDNACKKLADCLENVELSVPKIFNIETSPMVVKYYIKFSKLCSTIVDKFSVDWNKNSSLYNEAVISNDKKNYTLSPSLLDEGLLNFKIDIFFSDKIFTSIESQAKLILNKVKIIIFIFS